MHTDSFVSLKFKENSQGLRIYCTGLFQDKHFLALNTNK